MAINFQKIAAGAATRGIVNLTEVTPSVNDLPFVPAWLMVSEDAIVTMTFANGNSVELPLKAGIQYAIHPVKITDISAGVCWIDAGAV